MLVVKWDKQCRFRWDGSLQAVLSGSTLFAIDSVSVHKVERDIHCSAVIARSLGSMNADCDLSGPRSTDLGNPHPLFCMHDCRFLLLLWDVTYCTYFLSYIACCLCLFIVETLCMYLAWYPLHCFYPVNSKFVNFKMFVALLWPIKHP